MSATLIAAGPLTFSSLFLMGISLFLLSALIRDFSVTFRRNTALNHFFYGCLFVASRHFLEVFTSYSSFDDGRHFSTLVLLLGFAFFLEACRQRNQFTAPSSGPAALFPILGWLTLLSVPAFFSGPHSDLPFSPTLPWPIGCLIYSLGILPVWFEGKEPTPHGDSLRRISILWWIQVFLLIPPFKLGQSPSCLYFEGMGGEYNLLPRGLILLGAVLPIWVQAPLSPNLQGSLRGQLTKVRKKFVSILVFFLVSSYLGALFISRHQLEEALDYGIRDTILMANLTHELIEKTQAGATLLSTSKAIKSLMAAISPDSLVQADLALDRYDRAFTDSIVYVIDATGTVVVSSNRGGSDSLVGLDLKFRPYFSEALKGSPTMYFALGKFNKERGLYCSAPIHDHTGSTVMGVAVIKTSLNHLDKRFSMAPPTFLIDEKGIILAGNRSEFFLRPLWPLSETQIQDTQSGEQYGKLAAPLLDFKPEDGQEIRFNHSNALFTHSGLPGRKWSLVQFSPASHAELHPRALFGFTLLFMAIAWVLWRSLEGQISSEAAARQSEEHIRGIFDSSPIGIVFTEIVTGRIRDINQAGADLIGLERHFIRGKPRKDFFQTPPATETASPSGASQNEESVLKNQLGAMVPVLIKKVEINLWGRSFFLESLIDISQRKLMEDELRTAKELAEAANLAKSRFLATMSHELRTPLNAILGFAEILLMEVHAQSQKDDLKLLRNAGKDLLSLINNILDFSQAGEFSSSMTRISFDPSILVEEVCKKHLETINRKSLELKKEVDQGLPEKVLGVPKLLEIVLDQLVENAVKFTSSGRIVVSATFTDDPKTTGRLHFSISDSGCGIPREKIATLFHPFTQVDGSHSRKFGGIGLGLAFCKQLIESLGGTISVHSQPGSGSRFSFSVPASIVTPLIDGPSEPASPEKGVRLNQAEKIGQQSVKVAPGPSLLLVEDNEVNQFMARSLLENAGYGVTLARNGREALDWVRKRLFHAILMDLQMPEMDGPSAARAIKEEEKRSGRRTPIIALSANAFPEDKKLCAEAGMDGFLSKPLDLQALRNLLETRNSDPKAASSNEVPSKSNNPSEKSGPQKSYPSPKPPTFDPKKLLERVCNDQSVLTQLCQLFFSRFPDQVRELDETIKAGNSEKAAQIAHKLKGAVGNFSAGEAYDIVAQTEALLREGNLKDSASKIGQMKQSLDCLQSDLKEFLKNSSGENQT